jgi:hypothetical protein
MMNGAPAAQTGVQPLKTANKIENGPIMKLGNPKHDKYGTRKLAKGGCSTLTCLFSMFSILLARISVLPVSPGGLQRVFSTSSKAGPNPISVKQAGRLTQMASGHQVAKKVPEI